MPLNANLLTLAASNVLIPAFWRPAVLPLGTRIHLRNLDPVKRPWRGFIDGVGEYAIDELGAEASSTKSVELLFAPAYDPVAKLAVTQFPKL